jgi:putative membrane protein
MNRDKLALRVIYAVSAAVFVVVAVLFAQPKRGTLPEWAAWLPGLNAVINGTCAVLLVASRVAIARGRREAHRMMNLACFALSSVFLVSYVIFHSFGVETRYPAGSPLRPVYLAILLTHILLAAGVLPLVLVAFYRALTGQWERHRRVVRWAWPVWLYVTVSGVIVYVMIAPHYPFRAGV